MPAVIGPLTEVRFMGARIIQVDLAQPLPTLQTTSAARRDPAPIWILVKLGPQPVGWVRCDDPKKFGKQIGPDQLLKLANDALSREIQAAARAHAHEPITLTRTPSFSIVICTKRARPGDELALERQLQSIAKMQYPATDYEVIVVGDSNIAARGVCQKFPFVRYAYEPRAGMNYARNTGWQLARCEIVAYLDDGAIIDPDWLRALASNYADAQVDCVTDVALPREIETPTQEQIELHLASKRKFRRRVYRPGTWNSGFPLDATRFGGPANISLCRATLETMGGFDVALNADGGVLDIFARVLRDGGAVVHDPRAIVFTAYPRTSRALRSNTFEAARAFTSFCTKHAYDLELGNHALPLLSRWFKQRLLAVLRGGHGSRELALTELAGGLFGLRAYGRAVRRVRKDQSTFAKRDMTPAEVPLRVVVAAAPIAATVAKAAVAAPDPVPASAAAPAPTRAPAKPKKPRKPARGRKKAAA
jgi:glycosyltransferase involved in cell wall biosynthesis